MIKLDYVRVVQFYLSEKEELKIEESTGIFGPNGVGKSAFLDGIQIVMLGANQNLISFNAQADEKNKRTISSYCLGQYGQGEQRARDTATTYITLVWRDTETNKPISTGVCIYASASEDKHKVLGRYVAPGVELLLSDHLEVTGDTEKPMEWPQFRLLLQRKSEVLTGLKDVFYEDGKTFVVGLLTELRGSMGRIPQYETFTRSFKFAMRMRFDQSIDHIVRYEILEDRPTNTGKFKEITNAFKHLKELVAKVSSKIESGNKILELYKSVRHHQIDINTWKVVSNTVKQAICNKKHQDLLEIHEGLQEKLNTTTKDYEAALSSLSALEGKINTEQAKMLSHASHKDYGKAQYDKLNAETKKNEAIKAIQQLFTDASIILRNLSKEQALSSFFNEINKIEKELSNASQFSDFEQQHCVKLLRELSSLAKHLSEFLMNGPMRERGQQIASTEVQIKHLKDNISRLNTGKADLRPETISLVTELSQNGLSATPVCDLVRVTDPKWQPAIEAYLANNVEALLIPREQETSAFDIYRTLDNRRNIYNVKVIRSAGYIDIKQPPKAGSVAELIVGDNLIAVNYLRAQFGELMRADTNDEALVHSNTLTSDGMLNRRGAFERLRLVNIQLKIGIPAKERLQRLNSELKAIESQKTILEQESKTLQQFNIQLTNLYADFLLESFNSSIRNFHEAHSQVEVSESILSNLTDSEYMAICRNHQTLTEQVASLKEIEKSALENKTRADEQCKQSERTIEVAEFDVKIAQENMEKFEKEVDFDRGKATQYWDLLINKYDVEYDQMQNQIEGKVKTLEGLLNTALTKASSTFGEFLMHNDDSPSDEVRENWKSAEEWLTNELGRLERTELNKYQEEATTALKSAQDTFCTDVASILYENFDRLEAQFKRLKYTLDNCPTFSNGERYGFQYKLRPRFAALHKFVKNVATYGPQNDLLGGPGEIPAEFDELINDKTIASISSFSNPLDDYREFYDFDIEIRREDPVTKLSEFIGMLSERLGTASGGEHRAPLYVIAGAALASAYRMSGMDSSGLRLMLIDEAFDKMSMNNLVATMRYFEDLGLQIVLASPGENKGALDAFLHRYYDVLRDPANQTIRFEGHDISFETRAMMRADLPEFYPELIEQEIQAVINEQRNAGENGRIGT